MLTGKETLRQLDGTINELRRNMSGLDRDLQTMSGRIAHNQLEQAEAIKSLAALRLDAINRESLDSQLSTAEIEVRRILNDRESAITQANESIANQELIIEGLEADRIAAHDIVDTAAAKLAELESAVQQSLASDENFQRQLEHAESADAIAVSAAEKAAVAASDHQEKIVPYNEDPLFSYLWQRGYGTSEYKAELISRFLDQWVASICRYEHARQSYWLLTEIPKRLEQHAERVRANADAELDKLTAIESSARHNGGVDIAQAQLESAENHQDELDAQIESVESQLNELRTQQGLFATGEDEYLEQCLRTLEQALRHRSIDDLTSIARTTMTREDDNLVALLRQKRQAEHELQEELAQHRNIHQETLKRMQEIKDVRNQFKRRRFDDLRSGFDNGDMISMLIKQVLAGTLRGGTLWDALRRHQRYRDVSGAWPDFGSGGVGRRIGRSSSPRSWHWPGRRGGGKGFRLPPSRKSRGRGGFRTGGGF